MQKEAKLQIKQAWQRQHKKTKSRFEAPSWWNCDADANFYRKVKISTKIFVSTAWLQIYQLIYQCYLYTKLHIIKYNFLMAKKLIII